MLVVVVVEDVLWVNDGERTITESIVFDTKQVPIFKFSTTPEHCFKYSNRMIVVVSADAGNESVGLDVREGRVVGFDVGIFVVGLELGA